MRRSTILLVALFMPLMGCGSSDVQEPPPAPAAEAPVAPPTQTEEDAEAEPPEDEPPQASYRPPFPNRQNLFEPLQKKKVVRRDDDDSGESVVLKGFGNVDGPMVVLSIDGQLTPLSEGAERYGVQVISIQPPEVVLQRGRSRWTATLD